MSKSLTPQEFVTQFKDFVSSENFPSAISLVNSVDPSHLGQDLGYHGYNSLHYAARYGNLDLVQAIYKQNAELINSLTVHGATLLHISDKLDILEFLLEQDSSLIEKKNKDGYIPFHFAAMSGKTELIEWYLSKMNQDQMISVTQKDALTALHLAAQRGFSEIASMILKEAPKLALEADAKGYIPLHYAAAQNENTEIHKVLLQKGYKPEEQVKWQAGGYHNYTPVHLAAENNRVAAIELFAKEWPESLKIIGSDGRNPLHAAAASKLDCTIAAKILCQYMQEADINAPDGSGNTPMLLALEKNNPIKKFFGSLENAEESFILLQKSMLQLSQSNYDKESIQSVVKDFPDPLTACKTLSQSLLNEGKIEEAIVCYKAAKQMEESKIISQKLMGNSFVDCLGKYPPFLVKETLEAVLGENYVIEFFNNRWATNLSSRVESFINGANENKKILLLLTDEKMTICDRAIKFEKKDEDECKFIYINPLGKPYANDVIAKMIFGMITEMASDSVTLVDLKTPHASEDANIATYIIEDIIRLNHFDPSASRATLTKSLPDRNFNPQKAEEQLELVRDTGPYYTLQKMNILAPLVFAELKGLNTKLFTNVLLIKQEVIGNFTEAIEYVVNNNKPAALFVYDVEHKTWSGLALKTNGVDSSNITLYFSDPENKLSKYIGGISKEIIKHSQCYNTYKASTNIEKDYDSGPATLENIYKFICSDLSLLSSSKFGSLFKSNINEVREDHIQLLRKADINVPLLEKVNFTNKSYSYLESFINEPENLEIDEIPDTICLSGAVESGATPLFT